MAAVILLSGVLFLMTLVAGILGGMYIYEAAPQPNTYSQKHTPQRNATQMYDICKNRFAQVAKCGVLSHS